MSSISDDEEENPTAAKKEEIAAKKKHNPHPPLNSSDIRDSEEDEYPAKRVMVE